MRAIPVIIAQFIGLFSQSLMLPNKCFPFIKQYNTDHSRTSRHKKSPSCGSVTLSFILPSTSRRPSRGRIEVGVPVMARKGVINYN
jgi:hypothetical protein